MGTEEDRQRKIWADLFKGGPPKPKPDTGGPYGTHKTHPTLQKKVHKPKVTAALGINKTFAGNRTKKS
jgi:hypothetical protein